MSVLPSPLPDASSTRRGAMSAADKAKLDLYPADPADLPGGDSLVQSVAAPLAVDGDGELTVAEASDVSAGVVTTAAQTLAGAKTLSSLLTAAAGVVAAFVRAVGVTLSLYSNLGAGSTDVCAVSGTSTADGSVHATATVWAVQTGIGGTPVTHLGVRKGGDLRFGRWTGPSGQLLVSESSGWSLSAGGSASVSLYPSYMQATHHTAAWWRAVGAGIAYFSAANGAASTRAVRIGLASASPDATARLASFSYGVADLGTEVVAIMAGGDIESLVAGAGVVLRSPNGTRWRVTVDNSGNLSTATL